jgi:hypothetical protein
MFIPTNLVSPHNDPILRDMPRGGRPLTRWEITQRASRYDRLFAPYQHRDELETQEHEGPRQERFGGIRRAIARVLVRAGERLDPQLA